MVGNRETFYNYLKGDKERVCFRVVLAKPFTISLAFQTARATKASDDTRRPSSQLMPDVDGYGCVRGGRSIDQVISTSISIVPCSLVGRL